ncbi:RNA-binding signal recognition particle subunit SEC65 NDAI_0E00380 [Naumovozyma dairenensis CBS 421]|uniref:Signal recognition particle SEC65 subunit n=1 Tax=Naumovozyma dairenensis (strain ATCC 10597 / BCRC 20456 / CBS 421 / NBRC 0211 / NRRL Y-12639) TaxID=1071378 RepID=G0WAT4_NAUDC|nr:hypothetical protein NDAI_0E00380 [Naumovozyma dairenensis CBS 421]CCD24854.1 hypothetical protein NDAI_0E00380 [Naumovozyma dairenensis CBS 421]
MPKLEEITDYNDIDDLDMDLAELDPSLRTPIAPKITPTVVRSQDNEEATQLPDFATQFQQSNYNNIGNENAFAFINPQTGKIERSKQVSKEILKDMKKFQILYPCYFDKNRSHKEGRRVPKELAVENPLAKTMADAAGNLGLICVFEDQKTHPQDFGNPGRIRILLKQNGQIAADGNRFKGGKRELMKSIAKYLQKHPTTLKSLRELPYGPDYDGVESKKIPRVKGFKMNDIVPLHSPLLMGHPMVKSIYEEQPQAPKPAINDKPMKMPKNKYKVIRR